MNPATKTAGFCLILLAFVFIFPLGADTPLDEEPILNEDPVEEEPLLTEEPLFDEYPLPDDDLFPDEEPFYEDYFPDDDPLLIPDEEPIPDDDFFSDEDSLIFEAPPLIFEVPLFIYEPRSFDAIFPGISRVQKRIAFSAEGLRYSFEKDGSPMLMPDPDSGIDLLGRIAAKDPSHIIEALVVVPYNEKELDMLDIYNAMGRIGSIKDYTLPVNDRVFTMFMETTRIESARNRKDIPDPPASDTLPHSETIYLRFKDVTLGNLYMRADISMSLYGITYTMTNFTTVRYFIFPVMRSERYATIIYLEPLKEGILIYSMTGFYIPGFLADRINLTPNINRRISVLINWITDGLRIQENENAENEDKDDI